jgi:UDP-glucose 4-epimerase
MDFVHVQDVARANILGATSGISDEVFNVAIGVETTLLQLAQALTRVMGREGLDPVFAPERSVNPVPRRVASTSKAEKLLGFRAGISLEDGLRGLVDWWRIERSRSSAAEQPKAAAS